MADAETGAQHSRPTGAVLSAMRPSMDGTVLRLP